jgi:hypothetical protein
MPEQARKTLAYTVMTLAQHIFVTLEILREFCSKTLIITVHLMRGGNAGNLGTSLSASEDETHVELFCCSKPLLM